MTPDLATAIIVGVVAVGMFALATLSGEDIKVMRTLPGYVRLSALVFGAGCMARSVDLLDLAHHPAALMPGHINIIGLLCSMGLAIFVGSLVIYHASEKAPALIWARRNWAVRQIVDHPELAPLMMSSGDIAKVGQATGMPAVGPDGGGHELLREVARAGHQQRRPTVT